MAQTLSAKKRVRQNEKRRARNRAHRTRLRSKIKKLRQAIEASNKDQASKLLPETLSLVDVMVSKGAIHENAGNRYKSRLSRQLNSLGAG